MSTEVTVLPPTPAGARGAGVNAAILKLAWPVVLERLSISLLSAVDAVLVGQYVGDDGLAAIGVGTLLFWIPLGGALAIDVGSTAVVARDVGAGDWSRTQLGLATAIVAGLVWGVLSAAFLFAFAPQLMRLMGAEADVVPLGVDYLRAGALSFPFVMVLYAVAGSFRGAGNTWMTMLILVAVNAVNALVTFLLISGTVAELEVLASGIGYASGGIAGGLIALALAFSPVGPIQVDLAVVRRIERAAFGRLMRIGVPVGLEETQFMLAFLAYTAIVATLGTQQLAAHTLALRSLEVAILPGFALGTAATALVGQRLGGADPAGAEEVARRVRLIAVSALSTMAVVQFAAAPYIVRLFVDDPEVVHDGTRLLRVFAAALPALGLHSSMSGVLRGAGDVRFVLGTFTATAWGVRVPLAALLVLGLGLSVPFAWLAAVTENWVRAALVTWRFRQGKWKSIKV